MYPYVFIAQQKDSRGIFKVQTTRLTVSCVSLLELRVWSNLHGALTERLFGKIKMNSTGPCFNLQFNLASAGFVSSSDTSLETIKLNQSKITIFFFFF